MNIICYLSKNWVAIGTLLISAITLHWLIKYTRATQKMVENQTLPSVNVNLSYDKSSNTSFLWFSNDSKIPARVIINIKNNKGESIFNLNSLFIAPSHIQYTELRRTAGFNLDKSGEITMDSTITSAFKNIYGKWEFSKSYRFNSNLSEWNETSWDYPDPMFPGQKSS